MDNRIDVAVGIIINDDQEILIAKRQAHQSQGNYWEFPGGKLEKGELVSEALKRELYEEVGIEVLAHVLWKVVEHDYKNKRVRLHVHKVTAFKGKAWSKEGQAIQWIAKEALKSFIFPLANHLIVEDLLKESLYFFSSSEVSCS